MVQRPATEHDSQATHTIGHALFRKHWRPADRRMSADLRRKRERHLSQWLALTETGFHTRSTNVRSQASTPQAPEGPMVRAPMVVASSALGICRSPKRPASCSTRSAGYLARKGQVPRRMAHGRREHKTEYQASQRALHTYTHRINSVDTGKPLGAHYKRKPDCRLCMAAPAQAEGTKACERLQRTTVVKPRPLEDLSSPTRCPAWGNTHMN